MTRGWKGPLGQDGCRYDLTTRADLRRIKISTTQPEKCFSRMRSKGSRFTVGVWGLSRVRLTLLNHPQPFATVRKCPREGRMAVPMVRSAKGGSCLQVFSVAGRRFAWQAWHHVTLQHFS